MYDDIFGWENEHRRLPWENLASPFPLFFTVAFPLQIMEGSPDSQIAGVVFLYSADLPPVISLFGSGEKKGNIMDMEIVYQLGLQL